MYSWVRDEYTVQAKKKLLFTAYPTPPPVSDIWAVCYVFNYDSIYICQLQYGAGWGKIVVAVKSL